MNNAIKHESDNTAIISDSNSDCGMLMTTISGEALEYYYTLSEDEIRTQCMGVLRGLFPDQTVPEPVSVLKTRWGYDEYIGMSYSYVTVGGTSEDYDVISREECSGCVHFAGEVCQLY